jgi:hypothetical protein
VGCCNVFASRLAAAGAVDDAAGVAAASKLQLRLIVPFPNRSAHTLPGWDVNWLLPLAFGSWRLLLLSLACCRCSSWSVVLPLLLLLLLLLLLSDCYSPSSLRL